MIQIIIKYGKPIVLAVTKAAGAIPGIIWIWGTVTTKIGDHLQVKPGDHKIIKI